LTFDIKINSFEEPKIFWQLFKQKHQSFVSKLFSLHIATSSRCVICHNSDTNNVGEKIIQITEEDISTHGLTSLQDAIDNIYFKQFFYPDISSTQPLTECEKCVPVDKVWNKAKKEWKTVFNRTRRNKKTIIYHLPNYIIIQIVRQRFDVELQISRKLDLDVNGMFLKLIFYYLIKFID